MTEAGNLADLLFARLADHRSQWSLGTWGAIAEFARDEHEPAGLSRDAGSISALTARGGLRIDCAGIRTAMLGEACIALCLPQAQCAMGRRALLTEIGPDSGALREEDRKAPLFDLGLDVLQLDACVRAPDPALAAELRACCGESIFSPGNPAFGILLATNPHRVFASRVGRIEVYQPIPPHGGESPEGPHTHLLPELLRERRTHAPEASIPAGLVACAYVNAAHLAQHAATA
ncbi:MAG: hypothetical protein WBO23_01890 [Burkholderiales bacterium]